MSEVVNSDRICNICGKEFEFPYLLDRHKSKKNPCKKKSDDYQCEYCNLCCSNKYNLLRHINTKCKSRPKDNIENNQDNRDNKNNQNLFDINTLSNAFNLLVTLNRSFNQLQNPQANNQANNQSNNNLESNIANILNTFRQITNNQTNQANQANENQNKKCRNYKQC
jgi:hypothetical protein